MNIPLLVACLAMPLGAQWLNSRMPGVPRTADGKPNLKAPAPRALDGKPDLSGVWHVQPTSFEEMKRLYGANVGDTNVPGMEIDTISKYAINILLDFKPEDSPMRPEAEQILRGRSPNGLPSETCLPLGIPLAALLSEPTRMVQSPRLLAILYESEDKHRQIHLDGRALPKQFEEPAWLGYSVGKWDGDTLVVETAGFNDKTWLDIMGHPHSDALRVVERYRRRDFGHMDVEMTFDDPKMYTKPFTVKIPHNLLPDSDIFETSLENEKDCTHIKKQ
jgi:hypothetical protein